MSKYSFDFAVQLETLIFMSEMQKKKIIIFSY